MFAAVGCIYSSGEYFAATIRQKDDAINAGVGGALVGVVPGMVKQSMRVGVGAGVAAGAAMCAASFWYVLVVVRVHAAEWIVAAGDAVVCRTRV